MRLGVIGIGYVGLVTAACFAESGHQVIGADSDADRVRLLRAGRSPLYEPGIDELLAHGLQSGRLRFTRDVADVVHSADIVFISVGTPPRSTGDADVSGIAAVADAIAASLPGRDYRLLVEKSTVPVRTGQRIREQIHLLTQGRVAFDVACNPEFLREGSAVRDFLHPDRIVLGVETTQAEQLLRELYAPFECPVLVTDLATAELIKYASNAFLATKISFINAVAAVCERVGADVHQVADGMGYDRRIGRAFLDAGVGYGGSCFPKDVAAFIQIAREAGYEFRLLEEVARVNEGQREALIRRLTEELWVLGGRTIAVLGLSFKPNTDDVRESPAIAIIDRLRREGAAVRACDPVAEANARRLFPDIAYCPDPYEAARGSDALVLLTEWEEFRALDLARLRSLVRRPVLIDGRNVLDPQAARALGFRYVGVGR